MIHLYICRDLIYLSIFLGTVFLSTDYQNQKNTYLLNTQQIDQTSSTKSNKMKPRTPSHSLEQPPNSGKQPLNPQKFQQTYLSQTFLQCQSYTQIQSFNLKSSLLSTGLSKKDFEFYSQLHITKVKKKYNKLIEQLEQILQQMMCKIMIAQGNEMRVLSNLVQAYLKRTNMVGYCPVKEFSYNNFEERQKWLLQRLILEPFRLLSETESQKLQQISQQITSKIQNAQSAFSKLLTLPLSPNNQPKKLLNIMNKCEIHLSEKFSEFERCKVEVEKVLDRVMDGLNMYWDKLEEIGAELLMGVKSQKEMELEMVIAKSEEKAQQNNNYSSIDIDQNIQQSSHTQQTQSPYHLYQNYLTSNNKPSKPKPAFLDRKLGQMSNKRKGKQSILQTSNKKMMQLITNWYFGVDKKEKYLSTEELNSISDFWTGFYQKQNQMEDFNERREDNKQKMREGKKSIRGNRQQDNLVSNFYYYNQNQTQTPESLQQLLIHTYPIPQDIQSLYYYDQNSPSMFSLQHPLSNMLQSRLIYQSWHHTKLESQFQLIAQIMAQNQKKVDKLQQKQKKQADGYRIGLGNVDQAEERKMLKKFVKEGFNEERLPEVIVWKQGNEKNQRDHQQEEVRFQDMHQSGKIDKSSVYEKLVQFSNISIVNNTEQKSDTDGSSKRQKPIDNMKQQLNGLSQFSTYNQAQFHKQSFEQQKSISLTQSALPKQSLPGQPFHQPSAKNSLPTQTYHQPTLLSSLIQCYFSNLQTKYTRLARDEKMHKTFYLPSIDSAIWQRVCTQFHHVERVFVVIQEPGICLVRMEKLYNVQREMVKCVVYMFSQGMKEVQREFLKKKVTGSLKEEYMVTFSFKAIKISQQQRVNNSSQSQQKPASKQPCILKHLPCTKLLQVQCLTGVLTVLIYQQKLQQSSYQIQDFLVKGQELIKQYELYFLQDKQNLVLSFNQFIKFDRSYYHQMAKINYLFHLQTDQGLKFQKLSKILIKPIEQDKVDVFRARAKNFYKKTKFDSYQDQGQIHQDDDQQDFDQEDQGDDGRPIFVPLNRAEVKDYNEQKGDGYMGKEKFQVKQQETDMKNINVNKKDKQSKQMNQKKSPIQDNQLKPPQLLLDAYEPISTQNKDGIKRSNSRQQLKHINAADLIVDIPYEYQQRQSGNRYNIMDVEQIEKTGNVQNQSLNENQYIEDDQEEDEDLVGL